MMVILPTGETKRIAYNANISLRDALAAFLKTKGYDFDKVRSQCHLHDINVYVM